jgi:hypothetical protein
LISGLIVGVAVTAYETYHLLIPLIKDESRVSPERRQDNK